MLNTHSLLDIKLNTDSNNNTLQLLFILFTIMLFLQQKKKNPNCHLRKLEILGEMGTCGKTFLASYKLFLQWGGGGHLIYSLNIVNLETYESFLFFLTPLILLMKRGTVSSYKGIHVVIFSKLHHTILKYYLLLKLSLLSYTQSLFMYFCFCTNHNEILVLIQVFPIILGLLDVPIFLCSLCA